MSGMVLRIGSATLKHCSWLNQIEHWFSGLSCRILRRSNFNSVAALNAKIVDDIEFDNQTALPMNWKCEGLQKNTVMKNILEKMQ